MPAPFNVVGSITSCCVRSTPQPLERFYLDALGLSFHDCELLLKQRGLGQDLDMDEFVAGRAFLRRARTS